MSTVSTRRAAVAGVLPLLAAPLGASAVENIFSIKPTKTAKKSGPVSVKVRPAAAVPPTRTIRNSASTCLTPLLRACAPQNGCNVLKECAKGAALPFSDEKSGRPVPYVNNCWTSGGKKGKCG